VTPIISLVTGTWNRRASLARMIASFRACLLTGIEYEVVVVDGGSTDGTIAWCKSQPDITLIEQGELLGAIAAFDAGAYAATGDYVLLANDDIEFTAGSVLPAIVYLESTPTCGAVAFADDRPAPGYGDGFKVQTVGMMDGRKEISAYYPQVGLIRRWLGDAVGWWGSQDTEYGFHTYGGDNRLGVEIWRNGYTVDAVEACKVHDEVEPDGLRETNYKVEQKIGSAFYRKYPKPPQLSKMPQLDNPQEERLRILYMPIYETYFGHYKWGLREALARVGIVCELDYVNVGYDLAGIVGDFKPHLLLTQVHAPNGIPASEIAAARVANPEMVLINWNGDVYTHGLTAREMLDYLRLFDMQLSVNESAVNTLRANGIKAAYWQIGFEPLDETLIPTAVRHDVVFLANGYSEKRTKLGHILQNMAGVNVGIYGRGWRYANGDTTYKFYEGAAIYRSAKIAIGDNQYADQRGFVSNRIFEALANGVFLLHQKIDGLEELTGLIDGVHYCTWTDENDLQKAIRYWIAQRRDTDRVRIAHAGQAFVRKYHSFDARVTELLDSILPMLEGEAV
jgi:glycosyltransferase involved in cell wall biosynthesis